MVECGRIIYVRDAMTGTMKAYKLGKSFFTGMGKAGIDLKKTG
jgi:hypothetical protein